MTKFIKDALTSKWLLAVSRLWRDKAKKSKNFKTVESRKLWDRNDKKSGFFSALQSAGPVPQSAG
jgi:hypothetical protein